MFIKRITAIIGENLGNQLDTVLAVEVWAYIYGYNIRVIMKAMCPPSYHHNGFVAAHALGPMMYVYGYMDGYIYIIYIYIMYIYMILFRVK